MEMNIVENINMETNKTNKNNNDTTELIAENMEICDGNINCDSNIINDQININNEKNDTKINETNDNNNKKKQKTKKNQRTVRRRKVRSRITNINNIQSQSVLLVENNEKKRNWDQFETENINKETENQQPALKKTKMQASNV